MSSKVCTTCGSDGPFVVGRAKCKPCYDAWHKIYRENNRAVLLERAKKDLEKHRPAREAKRKEYRQNNKDKISAKQKVYRQNNLEYFKYYMAKYTKERAGRDIAYRLHRNISRLISHHLKKNNSSKNKSIKTLPYTIEELKIHIESQFESWMTWDTQGSYNPKHWDDNDSSTWRWQLDHITPVSIHKCTSMDDEEFKKCWALNNLRPLSAKQNLLDGVNRYRHNKDVNG